MMGTLGGFPNSPALWLRWAKPTYAYAVIGEYFVFSALDSLSVRSRMHSHSTCETDPDVASFACHGNWSPPRTC
jgi:hypothetical protein